MGQFIAFLAAIGAKNVKTMRMFVLSVQVIQKVSD